MSEKQTRVKTLPSRKVRMRTVNLIIIQVTFQIFHISYVAKVRGHPRNEIRLFQQTPLHFMICDYYLEGIIDSSDVMVE